MLALAALGVPLALRERTHRGCVLILTIALFAFQHGVLFFGEARYNSPLTPILAVMAAATTVWA